MLALYSLSHFWVELSCAVLVFRTMADAPSFALCLLLYNWTPQVRRFRMESPVSNSSADTDR